MCHDCPLLVKTDLHQLLDRLEDSSFRPEQDWMCGGVVTLPLLIQPVPLLVGEMSEHRPDLLGQTAVGGKEGERR